MPTNTIRHLAAAIDALRLAYASTSDGCAADSVENAETQAWKALRAIVDGQVNPGGVDAEAFVATTRAMQAIKEEDLAGDMEPGEVQEFLADPIAYLGSPDKSGAPWFVIQQKARQRV